MTQPIFHETTEYLEIFLRNLLLNENHPLHNRALHISGTFHTMEKADIDGEKTDISSKKADIDEKQVDIAPKKLDIGSEKTDIGAEKADIAPAKADIGGEKTDIGSQKADIEQKFRPKTANHILRLRAAFGAQKIFGRAELMQVIPVKPSRASALLQEMVVQGILAPVSGHGKGKYRFYR